MTNRRDFLKGSASTGALSFLGGASLLSALGQNANAAQVSGYKALVCLFFLGGQDGHDTVLPYDQTSYDAFAAARPGLLAEYAAQVGGSTRTRDKLLALSPSNSADFSGREYALPPALSPLKALFDSGDAAIIGNVGPLVRPLKRAEWDEGSIPTPARLFSHNDQQSTWMSLEKEGQNFGWGSKFIDSAIASGANQNETFSSISLSGNTPFLASENSTQFGLHHSGAPSINGLRPNYSTLLGTSRQQSETTALLEEHYKNLGSQRANLFERDVATINKRAIENNAFIQQSLDNGQTLTTIFPTSRLGRQLEMIARTINIKGSLNVGRQVFFVGMGGFDTHSNQVTKLTSLHTQYAEAIAAFNAAMVEINMNDDVTLFTSSEFGRSFVENGDGTDHGWGSHHFIVGGGVKGNAIYGDIPAYVKDHEYDAGNGRLIPQTSIEQYAATLGKWFGLSDSELAAALPNLANFTQKDLGFMAGGNT
ncbi:MAG: DUF1501 domain-containing protein [Robiginitomaculum sp.]